MKYVAYGSNLHPLRLGARVPSARLIGGCTIPEWQLQFHKRGRDGSAKCTIAPANDYICVAVFEVSPSDRMALDRIEGVGQGYDIAAIKVPEYGDCFCYVASETHVDATLLPYGWYKELVLAGLEYHGFAEDYIKKVRSIRHRADTDRARHARNMAIVDAARSGTPLSGYRPRGDSA
jgi:hypothetical protein